jgi:hypothetical protein
LRLSQKILSEKNRLAEETPEDKASRLEKQNLSNRERLGEETPEEKASRLEKQNLTNRQRLALEEDADKALRLSKQVLSDKMRRVTEKKEDHEARLGRQKVRDDARFQSGRSVLEEATSLEEDILEWDYDTCKMNKDLFSHFDKNPYLAALMICCNTGIASFPETQRLERALNDLPIRLGDEIPDDAVHQDLIDAASFEISDAAPSSADLKSIYDR